MKKRIYLFAITMLLSFAALSSHAATFNKEAIANMSIEQKQARIEEIKERVDEIKAMDSLQGLIKKNYVPNLKA